MTIFARLDSLDQRHKALEAKIADEQRRPQQDDQRLMHLKRQKLAIKDSVDRIEADFYGSTLKGTYPKRVEQLAEHCCDGVVGAD